METLHKKSLRVTRGFTYTYYTSSPKSGRPTLLLCHGWPDEAALWSDLITSHLVPHGYGVVAADCLGYAGTSKPTDPQAYAMDKMVADQIEILDAEGIQQCVSVGHDWGSVLAQRIYLFRPYRVEAMCLMNVAYRNPSEKLVKLEEMRVVYESTLGYFPFWYWYLFTSPEGAKVLEGHLESLFDACHGGGRGLRDRFCSEDGVRDFLLGNQWVETAEYATEERKRAFVERFRRDGMEGPLCWYKAQVANVNYEAEKQIPQDRHVVRVPLLFVGGSDDPICLTAGIYAVRKQGLVPELTVRELDAAHWIMLERPKELGNAFVDWLDRVYGGTSIADGHKRLEADGREHELS